MKICMIQNYSKNNEKLFNLTIGNHIKYCNKHEYSFITQNKPYSTLLDFSEILSLLKDYDLVFTIGSDVLITNLDKKIEDFIDNQHSIFICKEGHILTIVNGEIIIFKNDNESINAINQLKEYQDTHKDTYQGIQGIFNTLFLENHNLCEKIKLIEAGELQKYLYIPQELEARKGLTYNLCTNLQYAEMIKRQLNIKSIYKEYLVDFDKIIWKDRTTFMAHALGTHSNDDKFNLILDIIKDNKDLITIL